MSNQLKISKHPSGVVFYSLSGQLLTVEAANEMINATDQWLEKSQRMFVVDLIALEHLNSSGLNSLLKTFTKVRNKGGELILLNPSDSVEKLLKISKLNTVFQIVTDEETAINELTANKA